MEVYKIFGLSWRMNRLNEFGNIPEATTYVTSFNLFTFCTTQKKFNTLMANLLSVLYIAVHVHTIVVIQLYKPVISHWSQLCTLPQSSLVDSCKAFTQHLPENDHCLMPRDIIQSFRIYTVHYEVWLIYS